MARRTLAIALVCLLAGCGRGNIGAVGEQGEFLPYVEMFEKAGRDLGQELYGSARSISISFGEPRDPNAYGECQWHLLKGKHIVIHQNRWAGLDEISREALVFHELGHCVLDRNHDNELNDFEEADDSDLLYPRSVMNSILISGSLFKRYRDYYLKELFGK